MTGEKTNFQFILRLLNTNVDGKQKIMYALTKIKGVGRRYSNLVCKKADVDLNKRWVFFFLLFFYLAPFSFSAIAVRLGLGLRLGWSVSMGIFFLRWTMRIRMSVWNMEI